MTGRAKFLLVVLLVAVAAGAFYLRSLAKRLFFEPVQHVEETARARLDQFALQPSNATTQFATLYFPLLAEGKIAAESRSIAWAQSDVDKVRQVVLALAEGSHQGYGRVLPPSTTVRAVFLSPDGTAFVDLANDFVSGFEPGIQTETLAIYSIVNSITTNIPAVKRVQFLVQGQQIETLDGHADLADAFTPDLTRIKSTQ